MRLLLFIALLLVQYSFSQKKDSIRLSSRSTELKAWKLFFEGKQNEATSLFEEAMKLDSSNVLASIGILSTKDPRDLSLADFNLIKELPAGPHPNFRYSEVTQTLLANNLLNKQLPDSILRMKNKYDSNYIEFKAQLMDTTFEVLNEENKIIKTGAFKNRKPYGIWTAYTHQGERHYTFTFSQKSDTVLIHYFKEDGELVKKVISTGMPFTNRSQILKEILYWQKTPGKNPRYLFVSKEGFTVYDSQNPVVFTDSTPDNIIQLKYNPVTHTTEALIWKDGRKEPFEYCPYDQTTVTYMEDGVKKSYRWKDCKKVPIED